MSHASAAPRAASSETSPPPSEASFEGLGVSPALCQTLAKVGYTTPTPIQAQAIPTVLAGRDVLGCAQTGTGKTAAFALPILQSILARGDVRRAAFIHTLVLAPTRELAAQIKDSFQTYGGKGGPRTSVVFGGVGKHPQIAALRRGVSVLVATPGRLLDLMQDGHVDLNHVETFVLDEADRMLDMGFIHDVRRIVKALPKKRQTLLFSATMPKEIQALAARILKDPVQVAVDPISSTREPIAQSVMFVDKGRKAPLLIALLKDPAIEQALVFTRTKHGANKVVQRLVKAGVGAAAIHGNKSQTARVKALAGFKSGTVRVLVATDIAARGIDVTDLSHVVNFDLPNEPESYVHRVGRTGRAGKSGIALSFCSNEEKPYLKSIERLTQRKLEAVPLPEGLPEAPPRAASAPASRPPPRRGNAFNKPTAKRRSSGRRRGSVAR